MVCKSFIYKDTQKNLVTQLFTGRNRFNNVTLFRTKSNYYKKVIIVTIYYKKHVLVHFITEYEFYYV